MYKLATAILLLSSPAFAQNNDVLRDCPPIGQTGKGELVYSLDCKAIKAENADMNYQPKMPSTTMKASGRSGAAHGILSQDSAVVSKGVGFFQASRATPPTIAPLMHPLAWAADE